MHEITQINRQWRVPVLQHVTALCTHDERVDLQLPVHDLGGDLLQEIDVLRPAIGLSREATELPEHPTEIILAETRAHGATLQLERAKGVLETEISDLCGTAQGRELLGRIVGLGLIQVPEGRCIFPNLSVRENLELGSYRRARANRARNLDRVVAIFPRLSERFGQRAGTLSGGEQQMLAIGRGLMAEPRLLILDEPSLGLSPLLVEEVFKLIQRINGEGLSILLVEQNVVQSLTISHRAYVMENGRIVLSGPAKDLMNDARLKRSYLGM